MMSTAMVSLGIGTGFERSYKVLKRLGATPLGRGRWLAAKIASVTVVEVVQLVVLVLVAFALGWRPDDANWAAGGRRRGRRHDRLRRHRSACRRPAAGRGQPRRAERHLPRAAAARRHGDPVRRAAHRHPLPWPACCPRARSPTCCARRSPAPATNRATSWLILAAWAIVLPLAAARPVPLGVTAPQPAPQPLDRRPSSAGQCGELCGSGAGSLRSNSSATSS